LRGGRLAPTPGRGPCQRFQGVRVSRSSNASPAAGSSPASRAAALGFNSVRSQDSASCSSVSHPLTLRPARCPRHGASACAIVAHHVPPDMRVPSVALSRTRMAFPYRSRCSGFDRIHRVPQPRSSRPPTSPVRLDPDRDLPASPPQPPRPAAPATIACSLAIPPRPRAPALRQPSCRPRPATRPFVMCRWPSPPQRNSLNGFSRPRVRHGQQPAVELSATAHEPECSRTTRAGTTSHQRSTLPASAVGHALSSGLNVQEYQVLTRRRLPDPKLPVADSLLSLGYPAISVYVGIDCTAVGPSGGGRRYGKVRSPYG